MHSNRDHTGRFTTKDSPAGQEAQQPGARRSRAHPGEQLDAHRKSVRDHHRARFGGSKTVGELLRERVYAPSTRRR